MIVASEEKTIAAAEALERQAAEVATREAELLADKTAATETTEADVTMAGNTTGASGLSGINAGVGKKVLKPKMTTKERKERDVSLVAQPCSLSTSSINRPIRRKLIE